MAEWKDRMVRWLWDRCTDDEQYAAYLEACAALEEARATPSPTSSDHLYVDADTLHRLADAMTKYDGVTIHVMCDREGVRLIADHLGKQKVTVTSLSRRLTDALSRIKGSA